MDHGIHDIRHAIWRIAGINAKSLDILSRVRKELALQISDKIIITYMNRQRISPRKLVEDDHNDLVMALQSLLVEAKGVPWEFNVLMAGSMSKGEHIKEIARTIVCRVDSQLCWNDR